MGSKPQKQGVHQLFRCGFQPTAGRGDNVSNSYRDTVSDDMKPRPEKNYVKMRTYPKTRWI